MTQVTHLIINGIRQSSIECLSALDRGLAYGDGIFETMRVDCGQIPLWRYHYERLQQGAACLQIDVDLALLKSSIKEIVGCEYPCGVIKLMVTRGQGGRGYTPPDVERPTVIAMFFASTPEQQAMYEQHARQGVSVHLCKQVLPEYGSLAGIKTLNQLPYVLAAREVREAGCHEGLLFTDNGHLIEATARNVFLVKSGELYTPVLNTSGVSGVMRRLLIEQLGEALSVPIYERSLTMADLLVADEVFLSNSVTYLWPVVACGEKYWQPGDITRTIQQAVEDYIASNRSLAFDGSVSEA